MNLCSCAVWKWNVHCFSNLDKTWRSVLMSKFMSFCTWVMFHRSGWTGRLFAVCEMPGLFVHPCHNWCALVPSGTVSHVTRSGRAQRRLALSERRIQPRDHLSQRITAWQHKYSSTSPKSKHAMRTDGYEDLEILYSNKLLEWERNMRAKYYAQIMWFI